MWHDCLSPHLFQFQRRHTIRRQAALASEYTMPHKHPIFSHDNIPKAVILWHHLHNINIVYLLLWYSLLFKLSITVSPILSCGGIPKADVLVKEQISLAWGCDNLTPTRPTLRKIWPLIQFAALTYFYFPPFPWFPIVIHSDILDNVLHQTIVLSVFTDSHNTTRRPTHSEISWYNGW